MRRDGTECGWVGGFHARTSRSNTMRLLVWGRVAEWDREGKRENVKALPRQTFRFIEKPSRAHISKLP
jgi:hypothetical protein